MSAVEARCPRCGSPDRAVRACMRDFDHEPHLVMLSSQHCDGTRFEFDPAASRGEES